MTASFRIGTEEFPIPSSFTLADGALVFEAAGMEFDEFAARMESLDESPDIRTLTGMVAIAVARARPHWSRKRVVQFLGTVDLDSFEIDGGEEEIPPVPPPTTAEKDPLPISSSESTTSAEDSLGAPV